MNKTELTKEMYICSIRIHEIMMAEQIELDSNILTKLAKEKKDLRYQCLFYIEKVSNTPGDVDDQQLLEYKLQVDKLYANLQDNYAY